MIKNITINLIYVKDSMDLMKLLDDTFLFYYGGINKVDGFVNWNSFLDSFRSLDTESKRFISDRDKIIGIHLIFENYKTLNNIDPKDKKIFEEILEEMTHKENRYDNLGFSYEIKN